MAARCGGNGEGWRDGCLAERAIRRSGVPSRGERAVVLCREKGGFLVSLCRKTRFFNHDCAWTVHRVDVE